MADMLRRDHLSILAAVKMDPDRRELYVEGPTDRLFLKWLLGQDLSPHARVIEAQFIQSPVVNGGERGRLLEFARRIEDDPAPIRVLVDADLDRVLGITCGRNVWLTDLRDLEGYLLREECFDKLVKLGLKVENITAGDLLADCLKRARDVGLLRITSALKGWSLPFQKTELSRYVSSKAKRPSLNFDRYLKALMHNAGMSLTKRGEVLGEVAITTRQHAGTPDLQLVHGKDVLEILTKVCRECGAHGDAGKLMLWTSYERSYIQGHQALEKAFAFLSGAVPIP